MPQLTRPDANVANDGWTPTPLYAELNESVPNDGTFVKSPTIPPGRTFVVALADSSAPVVGPGENAVRPHTLTVRLAGDAGLTAIIALIDTIHGADQFVAYQSFHLVTGFADYTLILSRAAAAGIEDYTTLKVMVTVFGDTSSSSSSSSSSGSSSSGKSSSGGGSSTPSSSSGGSSSSSSSSSGSSSSSSSSSSSGSSSSGSSSSSDKPSSSGSSSRSPRPC